MSAERSLPWWASEGPVEGGVDRAVDPIERHRAARRGALDPQELDPQELDRQELDPDERPRDPSPPSPPAAEPQLPPEPPRHRVDACGVCPFCTSMRLLQETRPELVEHLTEAARHLAAAARSLLDTPVPSSAERAERSSPRRAGDGPRPRPATADGRLQRIVLDDPPPGPAAPPGDPAGGS